MHVVAKTERPWIDDSLPWKTNSQELPSSLKHVYEQGGQQGRNINLSSHTFGMGNGKKEKSGRYGLPKYTLDMEDVKERSSNMEATSVGILSALLLWDTLDSYWEFQ